MVKIAPNYQIKPRDEEKIVGSSDRVDRGPVTYVNNGPQFGINNLDHQTNVKRLVFIRPAINKL